MWQSPGKCTTICVHFGFFGQRTPHSFSLSLYLSLSLSVSLSSLSLYVSLSASLFLTPLSLPIYLCLAVRMSTFLSFLLFLSFCLSPYLSISVSVSLSLHPLCLRMLSITVFFLICISLVLQSFLRPTGLSRQGT